MTTTAPHGMPNRWRPRRCERIRRRCGPEYPHWIERAECLAVAIPAAILLIGLLLLILTGGGWGRGASTYNGLLIGTVFAAGAAGWLIMSAVSVGSARSKQNGLVNPG